MDREEAIRIFHEMHPDHFRLEWIRTMPENERMTELILDLKASGPQPLPHLSPEGITFGFYQGTTAQIRQAVGSVNPYWIPYFEEAGRIFCAFGWEGLVLSFCIFEDMGVHSVQGSPRRISSPGCVGTIPSFRNQGIGRAMIREAALQAQREGFDLSWIHYTHIPDWYARLGYEPVLSWNGQKGFF